MSDNNIQDEKLIEGHAYDDIRELDNPLPNWWLFTFFATIIFSFMYYIHYQFGSGPDLDKELNDDMAAITAEQSKAPHKAPMASEQELQAMAQKPEVVAQGEAIYNARCVACHAAGGAGLVGPNLTDKYWIHGKGLMPDLVKVITEGGRPNKGMQAWSTMLKPEEIVAVASFVFSLRNTNIAGGKAPEGEPTEE